MILNYFVGDDNLRAVIKFNDIIFITNRKPEGYDASLKFTNSIFFNKKMYINCDSMNFNKLKTDYKKWLKSKSVIKNYYEPEKDILIPFDAIQGITNGFIHKNTHRPETVVNIDDGLYYVIPTKKVEDFLNHYKRWLVSISPSKDIANYIESDDGNSIIPFDKVLIMELNVDEDSGLPYVAISTSTTLVPSASCEKILAYNIWLNSKLKQTISKGEM